MANLIRKVLAWWSRPGGRGLLASGEAPVVEWLEPHQLLSGVTLITHGYEPFSSARPAWLDVMANAIVARTGPDTAVYALRVNAYSDGTPYVESFNWLRGAAPSGGTTSNADTVVMLDWAAASGLIFSYTNTAAIAQLVGPWLLGTVPSVGIYRPLAETAIHLIGHSRGASVVSELARDLADQGVWVDEVTTLDPHPVSPDPVVQAYANVIFADNYYQTNDLLATGSAVTGAHNVNLTNIVTSHESIHAYYDGTIDTAATSVDGVTINSAWYGYAGTGPRDSVGFAWSRLLGGLLPTDGAVLGGAYRTPTTLTASGANVWDNVMILNHQSGVTITQGTPLSVQALWGDANRDATVAAGLDLDASPYDGVVPNVGGTAATSALTSSVWGTSLATTGLAPGTYYVWSGISNGTHTRFDYAPGTVTIVPDTLSPSAQFHPGTSTSDRYTFTVTYADNVAVRRVTLGSGNLRVTGPGGYSQAATFDSATPSGTDDPATLTATYWVPAPGGSWDFLDNGTYSVSTQSAPVMDVNANAVAAGPLGTFNVNLEAPATISVASGILNVNGAFWIGAGHVVTKTGPGTLVIAGPQDYGSGATLVVQGGKVTFTGDAGANLTVQVNVGQVEFAAPEHLAGLTLGAGTTATVSASAGGAGALVVGSLALDPTASLDLNNNDLAVSDTPATQGAVLAAISAMVRAAAAVPTDGSSTTPTWTGKGITSSRVWALFTINGPGARALGVFDNNYNGNGTPYFAGGMLDGVSLGATAAEQANHVIVKYLYAGDLNGDGLVNGADYNVIDNAFVRQNRGDSFVVNWQTGDLNGDGSLNGVDYNGIDNAQVKWVASGWNVTGPPVPPPPSPASDAAPPPGAGAEVSAGATTTASLAAMAGAGVAVAPIPGVPLPVSTWSALPTVVVPDDPAIGGGESEQSLASISGGAISVWFRELHGAGGGAGLAQWMQDWDALEARRRGGKIGQRVVRSEA